MARALTSLVRAVIGLKSDPTETESAEMVLLREIEQAHREWRAALAYCDHVTDPTDIDFAAYHLKSAQQRYVNLWQEAKRSGVCAWDLPFQEMVMQEIGASRPTTRPDSCPEQRVGG